MDGSPVPSGSASRPARDDTLPSYAREAPGSGSPVVSDLTKSEAFDNVGENSMAGRWQVRREAMAAVKARQEKFAPVGFSLRPDL